MGRLCSWLTLSGFPGSSQSQSPSRQLPSCAEGFGQGHPNHHQQQTTSTSVTTAPVDAYTQQQHVQYAYHAPLPSPSPAFSVRTTSSTHLHQPDLVSPLPPWQPLPPPELAPPTPQSAFGPGPSQYPPTFGPAYEQAQQCSPELPTSPASYASGPVSPTPSIDPNAVFAQSSMYSLPSALPPLPYYPSQQYAPYSETQLQGQAPWVPVTVRPYQPDLPSSSRTRDPAAADRAAQHKRFACPFPGCTLRFARLNDQQRHSRIHSGECPFACRRCGHKFKRSDARRRHELKEIC